MPELLSEVEAGSILWLHKPDATVLEELRHLGLEIAAQTPPPGLVTVEDVSRVEGLTNYSLFWAEG